MNFLDYLCEESMEKTLFVLFNKHSKYALSNRDGVFETWAVSPEKARANILYRLKHDEPDRYYDDVYQHQDEYEVMTKDRYNDIMANRKRNESPAQAIASKGKMPQQGQMELGVFPDPRNALAQGL